MMRRVYYMSVVAMLAMVLFNLGSARAQKPSTSRRGEPSNVSAGYFVVASDDNAPLPWRPQYFFVDTNYQPFSWTRVGTGPRQFYRPGTYFYNPLSSMQINLNLMDTTNEAMAGPFAIGFPFNFYGANYDSVYISSNGFIGFRPYSEATSGGNAPYYTRGGVQANGTSSAPVDLLNNFASAPPAIIAGLWADLDFRAKNDSSRVYYRTSPSLDTFMVNYYHVRLRPSDGTSTTTGVQGKFSDKVFVEKFQIVFTRTDSSVQINYGSFNGLAQNGVTVTSAADLFQRNATIGLVSERVNGNIAQATSALYGKGSAQGRWDAVNTGCKICNKKLGDQYALKFKRWHDIVRAISVDFPPRNYEICLGTSMTPKATFANVDSITQTFKVRFQIRNIVTGIATYGRVFNMVNMTPGEKRQVTGFTPYSTNPNILSQLGTFNACAIATTYDTNDFNIGDNWPFDDTVCTRIFGIRRTVTPFNDGSNNYSITASTDIPDQQKWVSIGAEVVDGDNTTFDPPPPRDPNGFGGHSWKAPVIFMNRRDVDGNTYSGSGVGDTLVSFPLNIQGQKNAGLSFDYYRDTRTPDVPWLFDAGFLFGPEHYVFIPPASSRPGDSMVLEFLDPYLQDKTTIRTNGCNPDPASWLYAKAISGEHDFEWNKFFVKLEDFLPSPIQPVGKNYFTADFRFRLRLKANDNTQNDPPPIFDDDDPWYIDNLSLQVPRKPDIEVMWVRCVTPYTKMPASQAVSLPIYVKIANNSADVVVAFPLHVLILDPVGNAVYDQTQTVTSIKGGTDSIVKMPNWNAQNANIAGGQIYTIHSWLDQPGYDTYQDDNGTFTQFALNVDQTPNGYQEFAYDDAGLQGLPGGGNDITNVFKLPQTSQGIGFKDNSGSFAEKFRLVTKDTIYGVRVYFGAANQSDDPIRISLYNGSPNSCIPADTVAQQGVQSTFTARRAGGSFDQWWPYYFPQPIVLPGGNDAPVTKGYYWMSISQLSLDNMVMGGDVSRGSGFTRVADPTNPTFTPIYRDIYGTQADANTNNGDVSCVWAMEITANSGSWYNWFPAGGYWPTQPSAGLPIQWPMTMNQGGSFHTLSAPYNGVGTYHPMIRPLVSQSVMLPIEMLYLNGEYKDGGSILTWATAKEVNNDGFFVERLNKDMSEANWEKIGFVPSKVTNSNSTTGYVYRDNNVTPGNYTYRLIQMDLNGTQHVSSSVNISVAAPSSYALEQNYPNPFNPSTEITFTVPSSGETQLVVYNSLGQVVRTLVNEVTEAGTHSVRFDGKDDAGNILPSGTYMYKITSGQFSATRKMTLSK